MWPMWRTAPFVERCNKRHYALTLVALPIVCSEVLPRQHTTQRLVAADADASSLVGGLEAGLSGRVMRSEQLAPRSADSEMFEAASNEQESLDESSVQMQTPSPNDLCAWATWNEWGSCTKTCGKGTRTRLRLSTGLYAEFFYFTQGSSIPNLASRTPNVKRIDLVVAYQDTLAAWTGLSRKTNFAARWTGKLNIAKGGKYVFELSSHDGARLKLDGHTVIEHNSLGRPTDMDPMIVKNATKVLASGKSYNVEINYFEKTGRSGIVWKYKGPDTGNQKIIVPSGQLRHPAALHACMAKKTETGACALQQCAIDCTWGAWSGWSACSSTCLGGTAKRTRVIKFYKNFGGAECVGGHNETQDCNSDKACPCVTGDCQEQL